MWTLIITLIMNDHMVVKNIDVRGKDMCETMRSQYVSNFNVNKTDINRKVNRHVILITQCSQVQKH